MQDIINALYEGKRRDHILPVSRFTFHQADLRNKADIADLYLEIDAIKTKLADNDLAILPLTAAEKAVRQTQVIDMVNEDLALQKAELRTMQDAKKHARVQNNGFMRKVSADYAEFKNKRQLKKVAKAAAVPVAPVAPVVPVTPVAPVVAPVAVEQAVASDADLIADPPF